MAKQPTEVVVTSSGDGYAQTIVARQHALAADEPLAVGGTDTGPDPYELLLASLGACTSITLRMYARQKQWPLAGVSVRLSHQKVHARDCAECEQETGFVDVIEKHVLLTGDLSPDQRARLLAIADKCPVHRSLTGAVKIRSGS